MIPSGARGPALIVAAVIVGIVLLQVIDDGTSGPANGGGGSNPPTTGEPDGTTSTTSGGTARPVQQVQVIVLNASGVAGAAANKTNELRINGYQTLPPADAPQRTGSAVQCQDGFEAEADALALVVGQGATVEPYQAPPPESGGADANCVVYLGV